MPQRQKTPGDDRLTVGDLREQLARVDAAVPVRVVHVGAPYIAALPLDDVRHWTGDGPVPELVVGEA